MIIIGGLKARFSLRASHLEVVGGQIMKSILSAVLICLRHGHRLMAISYEMRYGGWTLPRTNTVKRSAFSANVY